MNLGHRSSDILLGMLVVGTALALVIGLVFTQGWNERRFDVILVTESAQELAPGTKVLLEGLEIGRVSRVVPQADTQEQTMRFIATLRLRSRFPDGTALELPLGTRAEITSKPLGGAEVTLRLPTHWVGTVQEGDTLRATRRPPPLDVMAAVADSLAGQMRLVLGDSRLLLGRLNTTVDHADHELVTTGPAVRSTLTDLHTALDQTNRTLASMSEVLAREGDRLGPLHDSMAVALGQARATMVRLDTLAAVGTAMARENSADVHTSLMEIRHISLMMDYYLDQLGRKPVRMFTGIKPFPGDSGVATK
ncbi:MAG: MlaD family protein [Gemmatimonadales bacterium]